MTDARRSLPSLVSFTTLACGVTSAALSIEGRLAPAGALVLAGYLLDAVDGEIARRLNWTSEFGIQLDSLVDVLHFGGATAILLSQHLRAEGLGGWPAWILALVFLIAGAYRLARFNLTAGQHLKHSTTGLTISTGGAYLTLAVLADIGFGGELFPEWLFYPLTLAISALMVSRIPFPELQALLRYRWASAGAVAAGAVAALWLTPQFVWWGLTTTYIAAGVLRAGARRIR
jgi:CDP-diacylglycerol--serine O-phosphatidyltransferase